MVVYVIHVPKVYVYGEEENLTVARVPKVIEPFEL